MKTKVITFRENPPVRFKIVIVDQLLEKVSHFIFLECHIDCEYDNKLYIHIYNYTYVCVCARACIVYIQLTSESPMILCRGTHDAVTHHSALPGQLVRGHRFNLPTFLGYQQISPCYHFQYSSGTKIFCLPAFCFNLSVSII